MRLGWRTATRAVVIGVTLLTIIIALLAGHLAPGSPPVTPPRACGSGRDQFALTAVTHLAVQPNSALPLDPIARDLR